MAKICLCLTAKTIDRNIEILNKYRKVADLVELRVDCLDQDDRLYIRRFPELSGMPSILTIRRDIDGGRFTGGEGARVKLLARGLAFAQADSRLNFAYVDIEEDCNVPSLEEAARTFGTRIIRSYHNMEGVADNFSDKIKSMRRSADEIVKASVTVKSTGDVLRVLQASKSCGGQDKILICMGHYGMYSRILAEKFGSFLTYSAALSENEMAGAAGQIDIKELHELYRFKKITKKTKVYGVAGFPLKATISPWFFNKIFNLENTDAVYVPFPTNSITELLELANKLDVQGLSVTVPYKEEILKNLAGYSPIVRSVGACNTVYHSKAGTDAVLGGKSGWIGDNTDCAGFSESLLSFLNRKNIKRERVTIIGAGGAARSVAAEIFRLGGKALILNRTLHKARSLALLYNFRWGGLDDNGIRLMSKYNSIIIQTTSAGLEGYEAADCDPLELYAFSGKEVVMDLIYTPAETPFLKRAAASGCRTINGYDMVIRQACLQYNSFFGKEISAQLLTRINESGEYKWKRIAN